MEIAICVKALARIMPYPDPLVVSGFYLRPGTPGPAIVRTELLRAGRTMAFGAASLMRDGKQTLRATAAFSTLSHNDIAFIASSPPQLPPPDECVCYPPGTPGAPEIAARIEFRMAQC